MKNNRVNFCKVVCTYITSVGLLATIELYCIQVKEIQKKQMARTKKITQTIGIKCNYPTFAHILKNHGIISHCEIETLDNDLLWLQSHYYNDSASMQSLADTLIKLDIDFEIFN